MPSGWFTLASSKVIYEISELENVETHPDLMIQASAYLQYRSSIFFSLPHANNPSSLRHGSQLQV